MRNDRFLFTLVYVGVHRKLWLKTNKPFTAYSWMPEMSSQKVQMMQSPWSKVTSKDSQRKERPSLPLSRQWGKIDKPLKASWQRSLGYHLQMGCLGSPHFCSADCRFLGPLTWWLAACRCQLYHLHPLPGVNRKRMLSLNSDQPLKTQNETNQIQSLSQRGKGSVVKRSQNWESLKSQNTPNLVSSSAFSSSLNLERKDKEKLFPPHSTGL